MASKEMAAPCFSSVSRELTDSIKKFVDKSAIKFARGVKFETKNGKSEDRILTSISKCCKRAIDNSNLIVSALVFCTKPESSDPTCWCRDPDGILPLTSNEEAI